MILDPVTLYGEGQYNLLSLKEISVTDSFMGLDQNTRNCQNIETYDDCKTRLYLDHLRQKCGCLPLTLRLSGEVKCIPNLHLNYFKIIHIYLTGFFMHG